MKHRLQEKIDLYHSGRMNPEEASSFESELASDPSLTAESDFQSDIINGLKEYRKTQLKARLDAIDVSPVWFDFVQQSALLKSFGGVAVATLIGAGVYFVSEPKKDTSSEAILIDAPEPYSLDLSWQIIPAEITKKENPKLISVPEVKEEAIVEETVVVTEVEEAATETFNPVFEAPIAKEIEDEEALKTSNLDNLPETSDKVASKPIKVDYESTGALSIKYKYYDGKLFLSGDFDKAPYEILEINSADGRRIYVKYLDKFYRVGITDRLTTLPEVKNQSVIEELKLLRQNK